MRRKEERKKRVYFSSPFVFPPNKVMHNNIIISILHRRLSHKMYTNKRAGEKENLKKTWQTLTKYIYIKQYINTKTRDDRTRKREKNKNERSETMYGYK